MYLGDYAEDYADLNFKFTTRDTDAAPFTLAGSPVISVYKGNATATEKTSAEAYITLTIDFDGKTGLNHVDLDLSGDAFFAVGNDYMVVITTGSVNSNSVVGEVVAHFSIENRFMRGTDSGATATNLTTVDTVVDAIKAVTDNLPNSGALSTIGTDTARLTAVRAAILTDWINGGRLDLLLDAVKAVTDNLPSSGALTDLPVDITKIGGSAAILASLKAVYTGVLTGLAKTGTLTDTVMTTDLTEATNTLVDSAILYTNGNLRHESQRISAYSVTNGQITVASPFTQAPANNDAFVIIGNLGSS